MTYAPINDRNLGNIRQIGNVPIEQGSSSVPIRVKCCMQLKAIVHDISFASLGHMKINALHQEGEFHGRE